MAAMLLAGTIIVLLILLPSGEVLQKRPARADLQAASFGGAGAHAHAVGREIRQK